MNTEAVALELLAALEQAATFLANRVEPTFEIDVLVEFGNAAIAKARGTK